MRKLNYLYIAMIFAGTVVQAAVSAEKKVLNLSDCMKIGLENYVPLKLAEEEVELARLKRQEAYRGFFPAVSVKAEKTDGKAESQVSPDFTEELYGTTLTHNLYEGGKISATYK